MPPAFCCIDRAQESIKTTSNEAYNVVRGTEGTDDAYETVIAHL